MCFGNEEEEPGCEWTSPCRCCGATKWVHQVCLQQWIDQKQKGSSSIAVLCPQCKFVYLIEYPGASIILLLYEQVNRAMSFLSPILFSGMIASSIYWVSFTYGITSVSLALGREETVEFFSSPESSIVLVTLPVLPWIVFSIKFIRLETQLLKVWNWWLYPLLLRMQRLVHGSKLKKYKTQRRRPRKYVPSPVAPLAFVSRCLVGTFVLPTLSSILGHLLYGSVKTSHFKRTLLVSKLCKSACQEGQWKVYYIYCHCREELHTLR